MASSAQLLDEASKSVLHALIEVERQERFFGQLPEPNISRIWQESLDALEINLNRWQEGLTDVSEHVRQATDDLNDLDRELKKTMATFVAARKYLQGTDV